ncbi:PREDICTED: tetrapyrrole-binding protein, chloroplastic [Ipomoea nil]|uniref:tetrapyrrole-binding protein, chloroplastic n=1 Tax=Ipomoea nil TaxID=35883 RepID=UPI000900C60F|nr:PREDICTED: tetrapyrrole-binding protein, chloroplastic [Ipomoea nil]
MFVLIREIERVCVSQSHLCFIFLPLTSPLVSYLTFPYPSPFASHFLIITFSLSLSQHFSIHNNKPQMATNSINTINHGHRHAGHRTLRRRHSMDCPRSSSSSFFLRPATTATRTITAGGAALSYGTTSSFALPSSATTPSTSETAISYDLLEQHLAGQNFRQADEETRRLLISLAGDAAQKRGYVFFSEVQFIPAADLQYIDSLWRKHSGEKFGYSVQKKIWNKVGKDFTKLFLKLGWMKKLDTEVEQYNYRAFPDEFTWEISDDGAPPDGHLPLTNALRGTQLFTSILTHPAFAGEDEEDEEEGKSGISRGEEKGRGLKNMTSSSVFKPDYSF